MRICVVGPGAIGGHMALRLAKGGAQVCAIARGQMLAALQAAPLKLKAFDGSEELTATIPAASDATALGRQDIVVFSVKYDALPAALEAAAPLFGDDTLGLFAMNGMPWWFGTHLDSGLATHLTDYLDPHGAFRRALPAERWIAGVVTSGNRVVRPGEIVNYTPGDNRLSIGGPGTDHIERLTEFAEIARRGGYTAEASADIRRKIWSKLLINGTISAVSAITERNTNETCADPDTRALVQALMCEFIEIGNRIGIDIEAAIGRLTDPALVPFHVTSFLQDLLAGRPLEIHSGILGVREIARCIGLNAPHLMSVAAIMAARSPSPGVSAEARREILLRDAMQMTTRH